MKRDNTPWRPAQTAQLDWSVEHAPRSVQFDDVYYSEAGGPPESSYVFLSGNRLPTRWKTFSGAQFCVLETGFGTGLNFLQTWHSWRALAQPRPRLHYISIDKYPLAAQDLSRALAQWPALGHCRSALIANYPEPVPGQHRVVLEDGGLILDLWWEDVNDVLHDLADGGRKLVDAWYLDGFTPSRNKLMWSEQLFTAMAQISRPHATFATFTAASNVRRSLIKAGFEVEKSPGFGGKRECLRGRTDSVATARPESGTPWDIPREAAQVPASALIIGAGLAGCTTAAALAQRGVQVTLLEQNQLAGAGSGHDQGILYTRVSSRHSSLTDFALLSFCHATSFYRELFQAEKLVEGRDGALCGTFHQSDRPGEMADLAPVLDSVPNLARVLNAVQAREVLGIEQPSDGYWFPKSGWLHPAAVCRALIDHPGITLMEDTSRIELQSSDDGWLGMVAGQIVARADCAIIATGTSAGAQHGLSWLPLQAIRGQTTHLPSGTVLGRLRAGFCHSGYIAPAAELHHCIGATFDLKDGSSEIRVQDHARNLQALSDAVPSWRETLGEIDPASLDGKVSFRCATPDYLPIVGAVPNYERFLKTYGGLRENAKRAISVRGDYLPGLYLNTGHGSRGLTSAPLAAQVLASQICHEAQPLSRELQRAIAPARFIIRQLRRGRI